MFASCATFSLQRFYFLVQPTLHKLYLIYSLIVDLAESPSEEDLSTVAEEIDGVPDGTEESDQDEDDRFNGRALKEAMKGMRRNEPGNGKDRKSGWSAGGPVTGGEILAIIEERLQRTAGCTYYLPPVV